MMSGGGARACVCETCGEVLRVLLWAIAPSLPVSFLQNVRLRSVTVFGRSLISPDDRVMYEGVRVFWGRFFARGLGPSCALPYQ